MRKSIAISAVVVACSMAALLSTDTSSLAQAGGTGGTLGKTGKSASGGEEQQQGTPRVEPKHRAGPREASAGTKGDGCGNINGDWDWKWAWGSTLTTIKANGTATETNGVVGTWVCADGVFTFSWNNGATDHLKLSSNGRHPSGNGAMDTAVTGDRR
jgi:hypothetical protein